MKRQITNTVLMIRPVHFRMNEQTAVNNYYQTTIKSASNTSLISKAQKEFDSFVTALRSHGLRVIVLDDRPETDTPDAHFPNNWISFHQNGDIALYPMFAKNRRAERRSDVFDIIEREGFAINDIIDYTSAEKQSVFLEGTGSLVLDRQNRKAYCALSPRADESLLIEFCEDFEYLPVIFTAYQSINDQRLPIYHTNVMMCLGEDFSVICLDAIDDKKERKIIENHLKSDNKEIIPITETQLTQFAGNMIQLESLSGNKLLAMSTSAYNSLSQKQKNTIEKYVQIVHSPLDTIEACGGGSARCMIAEVFLPETES